MNWARRALRICALVLPMLAAMNPPPASAVTLDEALIAYVTGDYATALAGFRKHAATGDRRAQKGLGDLYRYGHGVPEDKAEAARWYRRAAGQGNADAHYQLGLMYREGEGVPRDRAEAARRFCMADGRGHPYARFRIEDDRIDCSTGEIEGPVKDPASEALGKLADRLEREQNKGKPLSEEQAITRLSGSLCRNFSENDFDRVLKILMNGSKRMLGREVPLEKAYLYARCDPYVLSAAHNSDLLRIVAEDPLASDRAARDLVFYFTRQTPNRALLGKIVLCRRDFGDGCVDVLEHIERSAQIGFRAGAKSIPQLLRNFKIRLQNQIGKEHLKRDRHFCRQWLDEPRWCE